MVKHLIKKILGEKVVGRIRKWRRPSIKSEIRSCFEYDKTRFIKYSSSVSCDTKEKLRARIIMTYHVVEKGLTMPNRRFVFGRSVLNNLVDRIERYVGLYGDDDKQVRHAIGVIRAYVAMNETCEKKPEDESFWNKLLHFLEKYPNIRLSTQPHVTKDEFYSRKNAPFSEFARARHTLRHYADKELPLDRVRSAVEIATSTPTACNRQHCHVYCVSDKSIIASVLAVQGGSRGFGHLADKLLIVVADLEDAAIPQERNDVYINGGMFLMNLAYSLFYEEISHCILNWSRNPEDDIEVRRLLPIKPSEEIIAMLTCGETPEEFDVAASPKKTVDEIFTSL